MRVLTQAAIVAVMLAGFTLKPAAAAEIGPIAVVDVAYIFKNDPGIKGQVEAIEAQLKAINTEVETRKNELKQAAELLKSYKPGSGEYAAQEEKVAQMESKLRLDMSRRRKELADAEAKIYFENYQQIQAAVKYIADYYKVKLVLRYNSEEMEQENGQSVIRGVMKSVVYHSADIDMTSVVLQRLNQIASK